jgi:hypothetical protein
MTYAASIDVRVRAAIYQAQPPTLSMSVTETDVSRRAIPRSPVAFWPAGRGQQPGNGPWPAATTGAGAGPGQAQRP